MGTPFRSPRTEKDNPMEQSSRDPGLSISTTMNRETMTNLLFLPLRDSDVETDLELKSGSKRKKTVEELSAFNDLNPELSQSDCLGLSQASKRCGTKFTTVLTQEKEKKKISIVFKVLTYCKTEY